MSRKKSVDKVLLLGAYVLCSEESVKFKTTISTEPLAGEILLYCKVPCPLSQYSHRLLFCPGYITTEILYYVCLLHPNLYIVLGMLCVILRGIISHPWNCQAHHLRPLNGTKMVLKKVHPIGDLYYTKKIVAPPPRTTCSAGTQLFELVICMSAFLRYKTYRRRTKYAQVYQFFSFITWVSS